MFATSSIAARGSGNVTIIGIGANSTDNSGGVAIGNGSITTITGAITTHNKALGDTAGQAYLNRHAEDLANYITPVNHILEIDAETVAVSTIDSYGWQDVDVIKIDVEGREWCVVQGAINTITHSRPVVQVEMWGWERRFGINNQHMLDWFRTQGYRYTNNRGEDLPWHATGRIPRTMDRFFVPCN